jgi:hypothetical protein
MSSTIDNNNIKIFFFCIIMAELPYEMYDIMHALHTKGIYPCDVIYLEDFLKMLDNLREFIVDDVLKCIKFTKNFDKDEFAFVLHLMEESRIPIKKRKVPPKVCPHDIMKLNNGVNYPRFCSFYIHGHCAKGDSCRFVHLPSEIMSELARRNMVTILCTDHGIPGDCAHIHATEIMNLFIQKYNDMGPIKFADSIIAMYHSGYKMIDESKI